MSEGRPRRGRAIVVPTEESEFHTESGIVAPDAEDEFVQRVKITQLGEPAYKDGAEVPWDIRVGDEVLVPHHAGRHHQWYEKDGRLHDLWIVAEAEIIHVFDSQPS